MCTCISTCTYVNLSSEFWYTPFASLYGNRVPGCGTVCMFQSVHLWSHTLFRMCTCISACIYVHPTACVSSTPYGLVTWEPGCPCVAVCVCSSHPASGHTPCLECAHASVCEFMSTWLPMSTAPLCIVWWKHEHPWVALCVCHNHPSSVDTPWLECVHASVHEFMSTWLSMSAPFPMHSLVERWVPMYCSLFVSQSPDFCFHTLFRMCTCTSTCIHVHLTPHVI